MSNENGRKINRMGRAEERRLEDWISDQSIREWIEKNRPARKVIALRASDEFSELAKRMQAQASAIRSAVEPVLPGLVGTR